jgi:glycosyltransferase involved in cell wall biosynthesis
VASTKPILGVIIPAYNEERSVAQVIRRVLLEPSVQEVVVVDDCSTDGTLAAARLSTDPRVTVKHHEVNLGKGAAIRTGLEAITAPLIVIQDADLEYDPADVPALIEPIMRGSADVVFGSRLSGGKPQRVYMFWHLVGNRFLSLLTNVLYNTTISDMETGYKAFRTEVLRSLELRQDDFGIEPEITAKICKQKLRVYELPIAYYGRTYAEGKKITWRDGFKAIRVLLSVRLFG